MSSLLPGPSERYSDVEDPRAPATDYLMGDIGDMSWEFSMSYNVIMAMQRGYTVINNG
jgi:hypothetical protein